MVGWFACLLTDCINNTRRDPGHGGRIDEIRGFSGDVVGKMSGRK